MRWLILLLRALTANHHDRDRPANQPLWALITLALLIVVALAARGLYELWRLLR